MIVDEESGRRCRRNGTGRPPMCQRCRDEVGGISAIGQIFEAVVNGRSPSTQTFKSAAIEMFEKMIGRPLTRDERAAIESGDFTYVAGGPSSSPSSGSGSRPDAHRKAAEQERRQKEALEHERARKIGAARRTLGFSAKESLTPELVKQRFRELAKKHHPDRVAHDPAKHAQATKRMAEINAAYEVLTGPAG